MIFTHLYIDNFYNFHDTEVDFTLKREVKDSVIEGEYLEERPKFRFKRVCILTGANATGKTSFGHILRHIQHFILYPNSTLDKINDKNKLATMKVEFVFPQTNTIHFLEIRQTTSNVDYPAIVYAQIPILKNNTAFSARTRLQEFVKKQGNSHIKDSVFYTNLEDTTQSYSFRDIRNLVAHNLFFYYLFSNNFARNEVNIDNLDISVLQKVLQTFDTSIKSVDELKLANEREGYIIRFNNEETLLLDKHGTLADPERLSKGTFDSIQVAEFIAYIIDLAQHKNQPINGMTRCATFYLDEKMAYSHSEIEQTIVNLIIQKTQRYSQFFYTTHNYDILDMNLPVHSYLFLTKDGDKAEFVQPENIFKKNDRSLLSYVKNDIFNTVPDISLLDELLFEE